MAKKLTDKENKVVEDLRLVIWSIEHETHVSARIQQRQVLKESIKDLK